MNETVGTAENETVGTANDGGGEREHDVDDARRPRELRATVAVLLQVGDQCIEHSGEKDNDGE